LHTQVLGWVLAGSVSLAGLPAAASAATSRNANPGAAGSALAAYHTYLSALIAGESTASARADQLVEGVTGMCSDQLSGLNKLSADQLSKPALTAFGNEVDADLDLAYLGAGNAALNRFASVLNGLTWATPAQSNTTARLVSSERALLGLSRSHICADAATLDLEPLSEPLATKRFLNRYRKLSNALGTDLSAFQTLLAKFQNKSQSKLVDQINVLVSDYSIQSAATEQADADSLLSQLGLDS
jgi:hypothetical protein